MFTKENKKQLLQFKAQQLLMITEAAKACNNVLNKYAGKTMKEPLTSKIANELTSLLPKNTTRVIYLNDKNGKYFTVCNAKDSIALDYESYWQGRTTREKQWEYYRVYLHLDLFINQAIKKDMLIDPEVHCIDLNGSYSYKTLAEVIHTLEKTQDIVNKYDGYFTETMNAFKEAINAAKRFNDIDYELRELISYDNNAIHLDDVFKRTL